MRVAIVSRIYRPEPSAASLFLGAVSDELVSRQHEVTVFTARPLPQHTGPGGQETVKTAPVLRDKNGYVRGYVQYMSFDIPLAFRLLFSKKPHVVIVEPPPTTGAVVRMVCALRRIPYVYDAADIWSDAAVYATSSALVVKVLRKLETFALRGASRKVTISEGVVERLRALGAAAGTHITGFGADTSSFTYAPVESKNEILYAGTYTELHGAEIIIPAFAQVLSAHPEMRLRFVGNGNGQEKMLETARHLGIADRITFEPPIPADELCQQLRSARLSLATLYPQGSYTYAFASKVYSSLAAGCPVVFSGVGPTADFMLRAAEAGVPVGDAVPYEVEALASAINRQLEEPLTAAQREQLAEWTAAECSMQAVASRVTDVVESAVKDAR